MGFADEGDLEGRAEPGSEVPYGGYPRLRRLGIEQECK